LRGNNTLIPAENRRQWLVLTANERASWGA
jgi:hypothetical protein